MPSASIPRNKRIPARNVRLKRAYEHAAAGDGCRVLIDRLWPRGVKKSDVALDEWVKDIAPSTELRKWIGHDAARRPGFRRKYAAEIVAHPESLARLSLRARRGPMTLVFSARDEAS